MLFITILLLAGCAENTTENEEPDDTERRVVAETETDHFLLRAVSEQARYEEEDDVEVRVKLMYTGTEDEVEIRYGETPFQIVWSNVTDDVSWRTAERNLAQQKILEADEWYEEAYTAKEAAAGTGESSSFFAELQDESRFPAGEYELEVNAEFDVITSEDDQAEEQWISTSLVFEVER